MGKSKKQKPVCKKSNFTLRQSWIIFSNAETFIWPCLWCPWKQWDTRPPELYFNGTKVLRGVVLEQSVFWDFNRSMSGAWRKCTSLLLLATVPCPPLATMLDLNQSLFEWEHPPANILLLATTSINPPMLTLLSDGECSDQKCPKQGRR